MFLKIPYRPGRLLLLEWRRIEEYTGFTHTRQPRHSRIWLAGKSRVEPSLGSNVGAAQTVMALFLFLNSWRYYHANQ
jgi:hypothetical protein